MKVLLIGAQGQLGSELAKLFSSSDLVPLAHADLDICDAAAAGQILQDVQADLVINTAAFPRVDDCETQVDRAFAVNAWAAGNLARCCSRLGSILAYISTDYVFDGAKQQPYEEDDPPNPLNVYGISKLAGEHFTRAYCPRHFIIRSTGLYGQRGSREKGGNFVDTMLRLVGEGTPIRVVQDQVLTPTYTVDLAHQIRELITRQAFGTYHLTNSSSCSWYEFAGEIFQQAGLRPNLQPINTDAFPVKARRPTYSVLGNGRASRIGLSPMRPWKEALAAYLREKGLPATAKAESAA